MNVGKTLFAQVIPTFIHISDGKLHDVNVLDILPLEAGAFYVMDRGYVDFARLPAITPLLEAGKGSRVRASNWAILSSGAFIGGPLAVVQTELRGRLARRWHHQAPLGFDLLFLTPVLV